MDRFIKLSKNDFIGREVAAKEKADFDAGTSTKLRRVSFLIDVPHGEGAADVMGDEPIWAKTSKDYGTVQAGHGVGAPRFDATGESCFP